jgi:hypothetical protein
VIIEVVFIVEYAEDAATLSLILSGMKLDKL